MADGVVYAANQDGNVYGYSVGCASDGGSCSPVRTGAAGAEIYGSPVIDNGLLYVQTIEAKLVAFKL